jgi:hypothetical protein
MSHSYNTSNINNNNNKNNASNNNKLKIMLLLYFDYNKSNNYYNNKEFSRAIEVFEERLLSVETNVQKEILQIKNISESIVASFVNFSQSDKKLNRNDCFGTHIVNENNNIN